MSLDLLTIFGAGLLTFLTPCVLPLVPIYLAALTGGTIDPSQGNRGQLLIRALAFSVGFILVFTALGLGASSLGAFLSDHKAALQIAGALLIALFALKFLHIIRIDALDRIFKADDTKVKTRFGFVNALVMGVVFAAGWSPCVGPVLGSVLTYTASTTSNPMTGALYLTVYGLGFAVPLLLVAGFAQAGSRFIARMSPHLPRIEKAMGALLLFIAGMLLFDAVNALPSASSTSTDNRSPVVASHDGLPTMVEFYSRDCTVCEQMKPVVNSVTRQCDKKGVHVKTIDVSKEENRHLVGQYRLVGVPTFIFFDADGQEAARLVGEQTEQSLKQTISVLRSEPCPGVALLDANPVNTSDSSTNCRI